jgi:hypothetical protein
MNYISAQPDDFRFWWEIEVQVYNFEKCGINLSNVYSIFSYKGMPSNNLLELKNKLKSNVILFEDTREDNLRYQPTIRPHILKKFFKENEHLIDEKWFYHDSDILFTDNINFNNMLDSNWYMSDIKSYLDYNYLISKGADVLLDMCEIFKINPLLFRRNIDCTGGCQYILHGTDYEFWDEVEKNCELIFNLSLKNQQYGIKWGEMSGKQSSEYHENQWWCADLWCVLVQAWKSGFSTKLSDELNFSWASSNGDLKNSKIFHNAGVVGEHGKTAFDKNAFKQKLPYYEDFSYISDESNSKFYANEVINAGKYYGYLTN